MKSSIKRGQNPVISQTVVRRLLSAIMAVTVFVPMTGIAAYAQSAPTAPTAPTSPTSPGTTTTTRNLDLSQTTQSVTARVGGTINVGGTSLTIKAGDIITPAQNVALYQALKTGTQSIVLNTLGSAVGGSFNVTAAAGAAQVSSVVIPAGVTGLGNFSAISTLNIAGNLTNAGSLYAYSTNAAVTAANINALNITNRSGALLTTALPTNFSQLFGIMNPVQSLSLNLSAINNIVNSGVISSSNNLSLMAGNSITNGLPTGITGATAVMQAANNINLISNQIMNSGLINAISGNLNIAGLTNGALSVDSRGGTLQALLGNINVRDASFNTKSNFNLIGGTLLSKELNVFSGQGIARLNADAISGLVNVKAGEAHVLVNSGNLNLGTLDLSGDPSFFNTSGDVVLNGSLNFSGEALAIVARGNILTNGVAPITLSTASGIANAGTITLVAGANFTASPAAVGQTGPDSTTMLTILGGSATGGKIDLNSTNPILGIDASSSFGAGANVTLVAYAGSTAGSGTITLPTNVDINAGGVTTNGNVTAIAGANSGTAITMGGINNSSAPTGGNVSISAATPTIVGGSVKILDGAITSGSFGTGAATLGNVVLGSAGHNITAGGTFNALSNGIVVTQGVSSVGNLTINAGNILTNGALSSGANISLTSRGSIQTKGTVTAGNNILMTTNSNSTAPGSGNIVYERNVIANGTVTMTTTGSRGGIFGLNQVVGTLTADSGQVPGGFTFLLGATVSKDGSRLYVPDTGKTGSDMGLVAVFDTATNTQIATISFGLNSKPEGVILSADGTKLYVALFGTGEVKVVQTSDNTIIDTISIPGTNGNPQAVAVSPDGSTLYVLSDLSNGMTGAPGAAFLNIVNTSTNVIASVISLGSSNLQTGAIAVNPQGTYAYVSNSASRNVYVIDLVTNTIKNTIDLSAFTINNSSGIPVQLNPYSLTIDPTGSKVYVAISAYDRPPPSGPPTSTGQIFGRIGIIDAVSTSATFNTLLASQTVNLNTAASNFFSNIPLNNGPFPQGVAVNTTGTELFIQSTYLPAVFGMFTVNNNVFELAITPNGPDGFGSNTFSTMVHTGAGSGINNLTTYSSNTLNLLATNNLSVIQKPTIQGSGITLSSVSGDIIAAYDTKGGTITANTGGGSVVLDNVGALASNLGASSTGTNGIFELGSIGALNITGAISSNAVRIQTTLNDAGINIGATVGRVGGSQVSFFTNGTGAITQSLASAKLIGQTVSLRSDAGSIGNYSDTPTLVDQRIQTQASFLNVATSVAGAYVKNTGNVQFNSATAGTDLLLSAQGSITMTPNASFLADNITIRTDRNSSGSIALSGQVGLPTSTSVTILADGGGNITQGGGGFNIDGTTVNFNSSNAGLANDPTRPISFFGSIGTVAAPIRLEASNLSANTAAGNVFLNNTNTGTTNVAASSAGGTFLLTSPGSINLNGGVAANVVTVQATNNNGAIFVGGTVGRGVGAVTLAANGTGSITSTNALSIPQGTQPIYGGATNGAGTQFYSTVAGTTSSVKVFDTSTNTVIDTISLTAVNPSQQSALRLPIPTGGIVSSADGQKLYVTAYTAAVPNNNPALAIPEQYYVVVIDRSNSNAQTVVQLAQNNGAPLNAALSTTGSTLYVVSSKGSTQSPGAQTLSVIDTSGAGTLTRTIALGTQGFAGAVGVAVNPANDRVFVLASGSKMVTVVNPTTGAVLANINLATAFPGENPAYITFDALSGKVMVAMTTNVVNFDGSFLGSAVQIDPTTNAVLTTAARAFGTTVTISSGSGNIGAKTSVPTIPGDPTGPTKIVTTPFLTSASTLSINTGGAANTYVHNSQAVNLLGSSSGGIFNFANTGSITTPTGATIAGNNIVLTADPLSNGSINLGAQVGLSQLPGSTISINGDGSGNVMQGVGGYTLQAETIDVNTGFGNIGSAGTPIRTIAKNISSSSLGFLVGNTFITNNVSIPGTVNLGSSSGGNIFQFTNNGDINIVGLVINASIQTIQATGLNSNIDIGKNVGVTDFGTITNIIATGKITNNLGINGGIVRGATVNLVAGGDIGATTNSFADLVATSAANLTVNSSGGSAYLSAFDFAPYNINIGASSVGGASSKFLLFADGQITVTGAINAEFVDLETYAGAQNGNIVVKANLGRAGSGETRLVVDGTSTITQTAGTILSKTLVLGSQAGSIGTSINPIRAASQEVWGGTGVTGNLYLTNTSSAPLHIVDAGIMQGSGLSAGGILQVINSGSIVVDANSPVSAAKVILQTSSGNIDYFSNISGVTSQAATVTSASSSGPTPGDVASITITNSSLPLAAPIVINYTVLAGDDTADIATAIAGLINANVDLQAAGISGSAASGSPILYLSSTSTLATSYATTTTGVLAQPPTEAFTFATTAGTVTPGITLSAGGAGKISAPGSVNLDSLNITLLSGSGIIGEITPLNVGGTPRNITAQTAGLTPTLIARTGGSAGVFLTAYTNEAIGASNAGPLAGGVFNINTTGLSALTVTGLVSAPSISLTGLGGLSVANTGSLMSPSVTLSGINMVLNGNVGQAGATSTVNATVTDASNINGTGTITANTVTLSTNGGNIGVSGASNSTRLATMTSNLSASTSGTGSVYLRNTGLLNLVGTNAAGLTFDLTNTSNINTAALASISSPTVILASTGGGLGTSAATRLNVSNVISLTATAVGGVFLSATGPGLLTLGNSSAGNTFNLTADQSITTGNINAPVALALTTTANDGSISMGGTVGAASTAVVLTANGAGTISNSGTLRSSSLTAISGTGNIVLVNTGTTNVAGGSTNGFFEIDSSGALNINGAVSTGATAGGVMFRTLSPTAGSIVIANNIGSALSSTVDFYAGAGGVNGASIMQFNPAFTVKGGVVRLQADGNGSVGSVGAPIRTATGMLRIIANPNNAAGGAPNATVSNIGDVLLLVGSQSAIFNLTNAGSITINTGATVTGNTSLTLTATGGSSSISQLSPTLTTSLFSKTIVLNAGSTIGAGNALTIASTSGPTQVTNLTVNAGGSTSIVAANSVLASPVSLVMTGVSNVTGGLDLSADENLTVAAGAQVRASTQISLVAGGNITQVAPGTTFFTPNLAFNATNGAGTASIGTSTVALGINGGAVSPVTISGTASRDANIAINTVGMSLGSVNLNNATATSGTFKLAAMGNININAGKVVTGGTAVSLATTGFNNSITQSDAIGTTISAPTLTLSATVGTSANIGTALNRLQIASPGGTVNLTANAGGSAFIAGTTNTVSLINVFLTGSSTANGPIDGFNLTATANINLETGAKVTTSTQAINLTAGVDGGFGDGSITQSTAGTTLFGQVINLTASQLASNIGLPTAIGVSSGTTVTINAGGGSSAQVSGAGTLTLGNSSSNTMLVTTPGMLTVSGPVSATSLTLTAASIALAGSTTTSTTVLNSTGAITQVGAAPVQTASTSFTFNSSFGQFGTNASFIKTASPTITLNTAGAVYVADSNGATTLTSNFTGGVYRATSTGNLLVQGNIIGSTVNLFANGGTLTLNGNVGQAGATVSLIGATGIAQVGGSGTQRVTAGQLTIQTTAGSVGSSLTNLRTTTPSITSITSGGDSFITNDTSITYNTPGASSSNFGTYSLTANGNINISTALNASNVNLIGTAASVPNNSITVFNTLGNGTGTINLQAAGTGTISTVGAGVLKGTAVTLGTGSGSIGAIGAPVQTQTQNLAATVSSGTGVVSVNNVTSNPSGLTVTGSTTNGAFSITDQSALLTLGTISVGSNNSLTTNNFTAIEKTGAGNILVSGLININGGNAIVQNQNTSGTITFGTASQLNTLVSAPAANGSRGSITVVVGSTVPTTGTTLAPVPNNISFTATAPGQILRGNVAGSSVAPLVGPAGVGENAAVIAKGANVIFSSMNIGGIVMADGATINADPPVGLAAPTQTVAQITAPIVAPRSMSSANTVSAATTSTTSVSMPTATSSLNNVETVGYFPSSTITGRDTTNDVAPVRHAAESMEKAILRAGDQTSNGGFNSAHIALYNGAATQQVATEVATQAVGTSKVLTASLSKLARVPATQQPAKTYKLESGGMLFAPEHDLTVDTPFGQVKIGADSVVLAVVTKHGLCLYNMHDEHRGDVHFSNTDVAKVDLNIGQHMMVAIGGDSAYEDINPLGFVSHRDLQTDKLPGGMRLFRSSFSITSALGDINTLATMQHSANSHDRRVVNRLLKDAAILMQTKSGAGAYKKLSSATNRNPVVTAEAN